MVDVVVDFISLIKDIRGNQFDSAGLPLNGKWKDIKDWHVSITAIADQVVIDASSVASNKDATEAALASASGIVADALEYSNSASSYATLAAASATAATASETASANSAVEAQSIVSTVSIDVAALAQAKIEAAASATTSGNYSATAQTAATNAEASRQTSDVNASNSLQSADRAAISEGNTLGFRDATKILSDATEVNATAAANSASTADTHKTAALASQDFSSKWSSEDEDVAIDDGIHASGFSAYHWAQKAINIVGGVSDFTDLADVPSAFTGNAGRTVRVNAAANALEFVQGTASEVSLGNVDNTSDENKPISAAAGIALGLKTAKTVTDSMALEINALNTATNGITNQGAAGNAPNRIQISKAVYSTASQTVGAVEASALTRHDLTAAMIDAETIGTY